MCGMRVLAVEETSNAMALDGIMFEGVSVRVRRPNDYNPAAAAALGPAVPNPALKPVSHRAAPRRHERGTDRLLSHSAPECHFTFSKLMLLPLWQIWSETMVFEVELLQSCSSQGD